MIWEDSSSPSSSDRNDYDESQSDDQDTLRPSSRSNDVSLASVSRFPYDFETVRGRVGELNSIAGEGIADVVERRGEVRLKVLKIKSLPVLC
jgi:hypothetical protein